MFTMFFMFFFNNTYYGSVILSYNQLFKSNYYAWRKTIKSDVDEDGDRDIEQYQTVEDIARWKFKDLNGDSKNEQKGCR